MSGMRAVRLIAMREIAERVRGRALGVMTVLTTLLVVAGIVIPAAIRGGTTETTIGLVGVPAQSAGPTIAEIAASANVRIVLVDIPSVGMANDDLQRGSLDVALVGGTNGARAIVRQTLPATSTRPLSRITTRLQTRSTSSS